MMERMWAIFTTVVMGTAAVSAQPAMRWHKSYGGDGNDLARVVIPAKEGGMIVFGYSGSTTNEVKKSPQLGYTDIWAAALGPQGEVLWDRTYGGTGSEECSSAAQAADGGYLIGGFSSSPPSGTKTSEHFGHVDYWVIRIDSEGSPLWDRAFGGNDVDRLNHIEPLSDGGFLLSGYSDSGTNGNKTAPSFGWADGWIIRLNAAGEEVWQKTLGGRGTDHINVARQLPDGGFLLVGTSSSPPSGTKTDVSYGWEDVWIVRLDANGDKLWDRTYGGLSYDYSHDLVLLPDGDAVVLATSLSNLSGNKTSPNRGVGSVADAWVLRIDPKGNCVWQQTYGGSGVDRLTQGALTAGGLVMNGHSGSEPNWNKTSPRYGWDDFWIVRIDFDGGILWDTSLGSGGHEEGGAVAVLPGGDFLVAGKLIPIDDLSPDVPLYGYEDFYVARLASDRPALAVQHTDSVRLTLQGSTNLWYRTDFSMDLQTWTPWQTNQLSSSSLELTDSTREGQRFYRTTLIPPPIMEPGRQE